MLYNLATLNPRRTTLVVLAFLVTTFVALYPYLGAMEMCDSGECPYAVQSSHAGSGGFSAVCLVAVVAAATLLRAVAGLCWSRLSAADLRPAQLYLSPDPPPPRISLSR
jgi:hypothetical protein